MVKGYNQKYGIDFYEIFAPVTQLETIRLLLMVSVQREWKVHQMDVKSAFLNELLHEKVYVEQSQGYVKNREQKTKCIRWLLFLY